MATDYVDGEVVVPDGAGGPGDRAHLGGDHLPGPGVLLHHCSEHWAPPGPPGGEGEISPVEGGRPPPAVVTEASLAETLLEVV